MRLIWLVLLATAWAGRAMASEFDLKAVLPFCANTTVISMSGVCDAVGLTTSAMGCPALGILASIATATLPPKCRKAPTSLGGIAAPPHVDSDGTILPQDLPDVRSEFTGSLPADLDQGAFMQAEGSTYFWYYRQLLSLSNYGPCTKSASTKARPANVKMPAPKGWDIVGFFNAPPAVGLPPSDTLPFAMLLKPDSSYFRKRRDSCKRWYTKAAQDLKASTTENVQQAQGEHSYKHRDDYYDAGYNKHYDGDHDGSYKRNDDDEEYEQERGYGWNHRRYRNEHYSCGKDDSEGTSPHMVLLLRGSLTAAEWTLDVIYSQLTDPTYGPGKINGGFRTLADSLWRAGLGAKIEREISKGCRSITIAGHSLGGAVAQLLAVRIEALMAAAKDRRVAPVTAVTFGSPVVGDQNWVDNFNLKVNARQLAFKGDLVAQSPCVPSIAGCPSPPAPVATDQESLWYYARAGGNINIPGADMPFAATQPWHSLEFTSGPQLCDSANLIPAYAAGHVCSYLWATSQMLGVKNNLCWLGVGSPPADASLCSFAAP